MRTYSDLIDIVNKISDGLGQYRTLLDSEYIDTFQSGSEKLQCTIQSITEDGRNLRIGIIGAVKAGKSTFLNSLIFDGEGILPQAETPMTAALTKISYAETSYAVVIFYSQDDWQNIKSLANKYVHEVNHRTEEALQVRTQRSRELNSNAPLQQDMEHLRTQIRQGVIAELSESEKAGCYELVQMAKKRNVDVQKHLNTSKKIDFADLNKYVGSSGEFAPIVKHIEVTHNSPDLQGLEIIDTPGLNDPVHSRTIQTQKFIRECDVIFLLSRCAQFLTSLDIELLSKNLPDDGVRDAYLVASQLDKALLDVRKKWHSKTFVEIAGTTMSELSQRAKEELAKRSSFSTGISDTISRMRNQNIYFIAAPMFSTAKKIRNGVELSARDRFDLDQFKELNGFRAKDPDFLQDLSGIDDVKGEALEKVRKEKNSIIQERIENLFNVQQSWFIKRLEDVHIAALNGRRQLESAEAEALDAKLKSYANALESIRSKVGYCFEMAIIEAKKRIRELKLQIEELAGDNRDVEVNKEEHSHSHTSGFLFWKKTHYTTTTTYHASVHDVIKNLGNLAVATKRFIHDEWSHFYDSRKIQAELKRIIIDAFDTKSLDFDENDVISPVNLVLAQLTIPNINVETELYEEMIIKEFSSGSVEGEDIALLVHTQDQTIRKMVNAFHVELESLANNIETTFLLKSGTFVDDIESKLKSDIQRIKSQLDEKEKHLREYDEFFQYISEAKELLRN